MIKGADTTTGWWRSRTVRSGLDALLERTFEDWTQDTRVKWSSEDAAHNRLFSAALEASHSASQNGWRGISGLIGRDELLRLDQHADAAEVASGLVTLRLAGDEKALKLAVPHIKGNGPCAAITEVLVEVRPELSTRTTGFSDLTVVELGGDLADSETAERLVDWLTEAIENPADFITRTSPHYLVDLELVSSLAGVIAAASPERQSRVLEQSIALDRIEENQLLEEGWAQVLTAISGDIWTEELARAAREASERHGAELGRTLLGCASRTGDVTAHEQLVAEAETGSIDALWGLGPARELPPGVVRAAAAALGGQVEEMARDAKNGSVSIGPGDLAHDLTILNAWHPEFARWDPLFQLLSEGAVPPRLKRGALLALTWRSEELPAEIAERFAGVATELANNETEISPFEIDHQSDLMASAAVLAAALGALDQADQRLAEFLAGDGRQRRHAALLAAQLGRAEDAGLLSALARDHDPQVRATAAGALARLVAAGEDEGPPSATFRACLDDPGRSVPLAIARSLIGLEWHTEEIERALVQLSEHRSAAVRGAAQKALQLRQASAA